MQDDGKKCRGQENFKMPHFPLSFQFLYCLKLVGSGCLMKVDLRAKNDDHDISSAVDYEIDICCIIFEFYNVNFNGLKLICVPDYFATQCLIIEVFIMVNLTKCDFIKPLACYS